MVDQCTCCNGCSSKRQLSSYPKYSFPKKLLVAVCIVVIIAMCLMPTEAQPLEHKRRHRKQDSTAHPTKDTTMKALEHRRRHHNQKRLEQMKQATKITSRPKTQTDLYYNETKKIVAKLRNTRRFFNEDMKLLKFNELREYRNTIPKWLPTVNFVEIHYHDYRSNRSRKNGSTIPERKYMYLVPKLYKSLVEYEEIFKHLLNVELNFHDDFKSYIYKKKRTEIIQNTLYKLSSTIQKVNDSMEKFHLEVPEFNKKLDLSSLEKKVYYTLFVKNDYLALRGYRNLLNNWFWEFKCPKGKQQDKKMCRNYEEKLKQKISSRKEKNNNSSLLRRLSKI